MQPTYLPWEGYFNLISKADKFIFLDDVQFVKQSWQSRNYILSSNGKLLLSIPIKKHDLSTNINKIKINDNQNWRKKHILSITQNYSKTKYFHQLNKLIQIISDSKNKNLIELNIKIISAICSILSIKFEPRLSSEFSQVKNRSEKLIHICKELDCVAYISPIGSKKYIESDKVFSKTKIKLIFNDYKPRPYTQCNSKSFISHLSIIDLISNKGIEFAKDHIQN